MNKLLHFNKTHFIPLFWFLLIGAFITAYVQQHDKPNLVNAVSPKGVISLELGFTNTKDTAIVNGWKRDTINKLRNTAPIEDSEIYQEQTGAGVSSIIQYGKYINKISLARHDIYIDFLFIFFYTLLVVVIIIHLQTVYKGNTGFTYVLIYSALAAGICDVLENWGMLYFINRAYSSSLTNAPSIAFFTSLAASIKFVILIGLILGYIPVKLIKRVRVLRKLTIFFKRKTEQLYRFRVIVLGVLFFSLPVWLSNQGQDLLINSNTSDGGVISLLIILVIAAFLNWYLAKLFFNPVLSSGDPIFPTVTPSPVQRRKAASEKKFSRFLGVCTILIPAVAILNAVYAIKIYNWMSFLPPTIWLIIFLLIFFLIIKYDAICFVYDLFIAKFSQKHIFIYTLILLALLGVGIPLLFRFIAANAIKTPSSLIYLFWNCLLITICFTIFVSLREKFSFLQNSFVGQFIGKPILIVGVLPPLFFLIVNIFPGWITNLKANYLALPVFFAGILFYILVFTFLIRFSVKKKVNVVMFLIVTGVLVAAFIPNSFHDVKQHTSVSDTHAKDKLETYFHDWVMHRESEINKTDEYPVFLINTYGGGIRAAAFTSMTLTFLDSVLMQSSPSHLPFEHYTFTISGASGGTIGAAVQCAYREHYLNDIHQYTLANVDTFYRQDFLTPLLGSFLGRDVWASITAQHLWRDRSEIQEDLWASEAKNLYGINLEKDYDSYWDYRTGTAARYEVPLLFSNTLNVDDGLKGICAPVILNDTDFPATHFIRNKTEPNKTVSLITGAFLSARFPFLSPSGKMGDGLHFMDGGGKDNSGASTSASIFLNIVRKIHHEKVIGADKTFINACGKLRFYFVSISNGSHTTDSSRRLVSNQFEALSPLVGIINSGINGNAKAADSSLQYIFGANVLPFDSIKAGYIQLWPTAEYIAKASKKPVAPLLPLGWQISESSLNRLEESFLQKNINRTSNVNGMKKLLQICKVK